MAYTMKYGGRIWPRCFNDLSILFSNILNYQHATVRTDWPEAARHIVLCTLQSDWSGGIYVGTRLENQGSLCRIHSKYELQSVAWTYQLRLATITASMTIWIITYCYWAVFTLDLALSCAWTSNSSSETVDAVLEYVPRTFPACIFHG